MKEKYKYKTLYRRNEKTGSVIVDIALGDYNDFFHEWDNSPFRKRDIHPELVQFFDLCSEDIPLRRDIDIVISLDSTLNSKEKEDQIRISYLNYYNSLNHLETRKTKRIVKMSAILLMIAISLLFTYALLSDFEPSIMITKVLLESLLIGGWVFTWEAVHLLFLDIFVPFHRHREIRRFLKANLIFKYQV